MFIRTRKTFTMFIECSYAYRNPKYFEIGSVTKFFITFLSLRFFDMREKHIFFLRWLFHLIPTTCGTPAANYWSGLDKLRKSTFFVQDQISINCFFFRIPKILNASGHDVIHVFGLIFYLAFLLRHLWLSHPPRARVNNCAQCVHLTNPCTKRKVLSLTIPKGKILKTKSLHNYITIIIIALG